jgi:hypothetical protein
MPLSEAVRRGLRPTQWPTPTASAGGPKSEAYVVGRNFGKEHTTLNLASAVRMWPTPCASDKKGANPLTRNPKDDDLPTRAPRVFLGLWPTPNAAVSNDRETPETFRARQARLKAKGYNGNGAGVPLTIAVLEAERGAWPTPTARDWRSRLASAATHARNARPLNEAVCRLTRAETPSGPSAAVPGAAPSAVPPLNPDFVEHLMGFDRGWTDGPPAPPSLSAGGSRRASRRRAHGGPTG